MAAMAELQNKGLFESPDKVKQVSAKDTTPDGIASVDVVIEQEEWKNILCEFLEEIMPGCLTFMEMRGSLTMIELDVIRATDAWVVSSTAVSNKEPGTFDEQFPPLPAGTSSYFDHEEIARVVKDICDDFRGSCLLERGAVEAFQDVTSRIIADYLAGEESSTDGNDEEMEGYVVEEGGDSNDSDFDLMAHSGEEDDDSEDEDESSDDEGESEAALSDGKIEDCSSEVDHEDADSVMTQDEFVEDSRVFLEEIMPGCLTFMEMRGSLTMIELDVIRATDAWVVSSTAVSNKEPGTFDEQFPPLPAGTSSYFDHEEIARVVKDICDDFRGSCLLERGAVEALQDATTRYLADYLEGEESSTDGSDEEMEGYVVEEGGDSNDSDFDPVAHSGDESEGSEGSEEDDDSDDEDEGSDDEGEMY